MSEGVQLTLPDEEDRRWKMVVRTMRRHSFAASSLIETLHTVQELFGYIDDESLRFVARALKLSPARVYGVVSFYSYFTLKPQGDHSCVICMGTACYIKGADRLLEVAAESCGVAAGETSADGRVSLLEARCVGACGIAPVVVFDQRMVGKLSVDDLRRQIEEWRSAD